MVFGNMQTKRNDKSTKSQGHWLSVRYEQQCINTVTVHWKPEDAKMIWPLDLRAIRYDIKPCADSFHKKKSSKISLRSSTIS